MFQDPYLPENRYSLDLMLFHLHQIQPRPKSIRIATPSVELAKAALRRLDSPGMAIIVDSAQIQAELKQVFNVSTCLREELPSPPEVTLCPFSLEHGVDLYGANHIIAASRNLLSYKKILYPRFAAPTILSIFNQLSHSYQITPLAGLYSPRFVFRWALAKSIERLSSAWYFRLEDQAMQSLIEFGWLWRLSYIVVYAARHR